MGSIDDFSKLPHIGESVLRKEDVRFLTGVGQYTDDINLAHQTHAVFVRSPYAHATIKSINLTVAKAHPGVIGIFIGEDIAKDNINGLPCG
ncbi:MAG: xanthine dehydrogenase family protein molybdopterin-binding subunit, partial [Polynucleobacter sp.]|nr:xanthine dehydrogenase family protein molybdopterin-binding subunit [Polynucleobacter sp.]